jgi:HAD domain in Swiss Army Knife RNA repair proteins
VATDVPLLYMDFDGLLHHENVRVAADGVPFLDAPPRYRLFQHSQLLDELLAPFPSVRIILSTKWVLRVGAEEAAGRLPESLRARVVGTFVPPGAPADFWHMPKGLQVAEDVERRRPAAWLALDDDPLGWPHWALPHLLLTDPYEGISPPELQEELRRRLGLLENMQLPGPKGES